MSLSLSLYLTAPVKVFDRAELERIITLIAEHELIPPALRGTIRKGPKFTTASLDDLRKHVKNLDDGKELRVTTDKEFFSGTIHAFEENCMIDLYFQDEFVEQRADVLLTRAGAAARALAASVSPQFLIKRSSGLSIRNFPYPEFRPPRTPLVVERDMLIDLADGRAHTSPEERNTLTALREAELPAGVRRTIAGTRIVLEWAADVSMSDADALRRQLVARERWLAANIGSTRDPNWNDAGDVNAGFMGGTPHPSLTLYSAPLGIGYKAIHGAASDAEIDAALAQVGQWIKDRRVDEQTEVSDVVIMADSRESALALRSRMEKAGVSTVIYPDAQGTMWNPFPEGEWIEDS